MENKALEIVRTYIKEHLDRSDATPEFDVYTVWKCKTLQNWKFLISSSLYDGMYYELTYNGDKHEWYLDAYKKFENAFPAFAGMIPLPLLSAHHSQSIPRMRGDDPLCGCTFSTPTRYSPHARG